MNLVEEEAAAIKLKVSIAVVQVSHLPCAAIAATINFPIENKSGTNASSECYADDVLQTLRLTVAVLTQRKTVGVVFDGNRQSKLGFQYGLEFYALPGRNIDNIVHDALFSIDNRGNSDPDGLNLAAYQRPDQILQLLQCAVQGILIPEGHLLESLSRVARPDSGPDVGAPQIYTDSHPVNIEKELKIEELNS